MVRAVLGVFRGWLSAFLTAETADALHLACAKPWPRADVSGVTRQPAFG
jgi:hypothetical protein